MRSPMLIFALLLVTAGCERGSGPQKPPASQPQEAAADGLNTLKTMVNEQNYRSMGFDSADQVNQAQLGSPLSVSDIGLDQLKGYKTGVKPDSLLTQTNRTMYPVTVGTDVKSSITTTQRDNGYRASTFGDAEIIKSLARYRKAESQGDFVVRVPALAMYFLARRVEDRVVVIPIIEDPRLKVKVGEPMPLETVLEQLVQLVNNYNGEPM
jgi:hypothetical protein